jgi:hypothetical protein
MRIRPQAILLMMLVRLGKPASTRGKRVFEKKKIRYSG